jgi:hypothetical protein
MKIPAIVATVLLVSTMMVAARDSDVPANKTELKKGYVLIKKTGPEMGEVIFFHRKHKKHAMNDNKCKTCHHVGKWGQSCGETACHVDPEKDKEGNRIHICCMERCHKANEDKAPTDCLECHE